MASRYLLGANREAESRIQNAAIDRTAAAMLGPITRALSAQMRAASDAYGVGDSIAGAVILNQAQLTNAYVAMYRKAAQLVGPRVIRTAKSLHGSGLILKEDGVPVLDFWNNQVARWIDRNAAFRVQQVNETTIAQLQSIISVGFNEGIGVLGIQRAILSSIPDLTPIRARAIARTETHSGAQASSLSAAKLIGIDTIKEWNATGDSRTRDDHERADGQQQPLDQPFVVGGHNMQFPGDPSAPADEVVNCRCVQDYPIE